jgi:PII-like signaling protein
MSRRKLSFPILSASNDVLNKDYIKNNIEDLTKGEVVLNISGDNSTMMFFDENENLAIFESSVLVDKKIEKIIEEVSFGENKEVLDGITSGMVESWNNLIQSAHTHENKTILDSLTGDVINSWNNAAQNAVSSSKTYTDDQINFILSGASETFDTLKEIEVWINAHSGQAVTIIENLNTLNSSAHTHNNKGILDGITEEKVAAWDAIGGKQDVISDLDDIRNGAAKGATALQEVPAEYVTETELQGKGFLTEHQDISGKQDAISDLEAIRSGAAKGATALQSVPAEYITETELTNKKYATEGWVSEEIAKAQLGGEDIDPSVFATKDDIKDFVTSGWVENQGFLTEHQDITGKQDVISDLEAIRSGAAKGATALQSVPAEYVTETELTNKGYLTSHQDISHLATKSELTGYTTDSEFSTLSITVSQKQDKIENLETIINGAAKGATALQSVPAEYITETELANKGYATQTWVENKKYLTSHQDISGKQDVISDLEAIRSGASKGATALQSVPAEYVTETELTNKGYATQSWVENKKYLTSHQDISGKQDVITDLETIRTNAAKGATALQSVPAEYVTETELTNKGYLTEHQDISGKQDVISDLETIRSGAAKGATSLQSIGLTKVSLKAYLLGSAIKEGSVSALATSTDDIYMEDGELYATSDERLKDFGDNISVDLDKLSEIPKAYYTWKTNPQGRKMIGLSAQKIGALYPEVVSTDENGKMAVSYEKLSVIALAAIDELHKENEELKHRLKRIEEKLGL